MKNRLYSAAARSLNQQGSKQEFVHNAKAFNRFSSNVSSHDNNNNNNVSSLKRVVLDSIRLSKVYAGANVMTKDIHKAVGNCISLRGRYIRESGVSWLSQHQLNKQVGSYHTRHCFSRSFASSSASQSSGQPKQQQDNKDIFAYEDTFEAPTSNIPEKPVTFVEGASYSVVILAGLGIAAALIYTACKELLFEPKEYKVFGRALDRVQNDIQVRQKIGAPIKGYGQESRNRSARQRIPNKVWTDEDGVEHVEINFVVRGPHGTGNVFTEMFMDKEDKKWKYTFLIVQITSPQQAQLMLESYVPSYPPA